jgi:hypothetical protein
MKWNKENQSSNLKKIIKLVNAGYGIREISLKFNISFQRVSQVCQEHDISIREIRTKQAYDKIELKRQEYLKQQEIKKANAKDIFIAKYSEVNYKPDQFNPKAIRLKSEVGVSQKVLDNRRRTREYFQRHRDRSYARNKAAIAIKRGYIVRTPCEVCGSLDVESHHYNGYNRPLDVKFYCKKHHMELHRGEARSEETRLNFSLGQKKRWVNIK